MNHIINVKPLNNQLFYRILMNWNQFENEGYPNIVDFKPFNIDEPVGYEWKNLDILLKDERIIKFLEEMDAIDRN